VDLEFQPRYLGCYAVLSFSRSRNPYRSLGADKSYGADYENEEDAKNGLRSPYLNNSTGTRHWRIISAVVLPITR
jgi:hypothetical protein